MEREEKKLNDMYLVVEGKKSVCHKFKNRLNKISKSNSCIKIFLIVSLLPVVKQWKGCYSNKPISCCYFAYRFIFLFFVTCSEAKKKTKWQILILNSPPPLLMQPTTFAYTHHIILLTPLLLSLCCLHVFTVVKKKTHERMLF